MTLSRLPDGKAVPYGIDDLVHKTGFVNVGIDHETAEFAVESIRRWWHSHGKKLYPDSLELLITADGGGSNGSKNKLWKKKLQEFANEENLTITVAHFAHHQDLQHWWWYGLLQSKNHYI